MPDSAAPSPALSPSRWYWGVLAACVLVHAALGIDAARRWSPTHDEYWHLPYGLYYAQRGDLRADPINPPLVRWWAALPLLIQGAQLPELREPTPFEIGDAFREANAQRYRSLFFGGRLMILAIGLAAGIGISVWARLWFGDTAGMIAALLWFGCPTLLANAIVVTHDLPLAAGVMAALAAAAWFRHASTWKSAALLGVLLGLTQLTKLTAVLLIPLVPLWWLILPEAPRSSWRRTLGLWVFVFGLAWFVMAAGYRFDAVGRVDGAPPLAESPVLRELSTLLPGPYRLGWQRVRGDLQSAHPGFLNGEWREGGYPTYYLWALAYKLPLGTWALIGVALAFLCRRDCPPSWRRIALALVIAALAFVVPASRSPNQIGIRYILPAVPCLILLAAMAAGWCERSRSRGMTIAVWIAALSAPLALRFHPHHLTYFNEPAGGPVGGRQHLVDSNLDWGQDLHTAADWVRTHIGGEPVSVAYFGTIPPHTVGLDGPPPPQFDPQPGWYVVSANFVQGRPHTLRLADGTFLQVGLDAYGYFRFFTPRTRIGYSIDIYELTPEDVARFRAARSAADASL
jgi:hypothetical protein